MNFKKLMVGFLTIVTAVTAMMAVTTTASAAKVKEIYLDNYTVGTISNDKEFTTEKNEYNEYWYKLTLKSNASVVFTVDNVGVTGHTQVHIYKAIDSKTAGEEVYTLKWGYAGSYTAKLDKGTYFVKFTKAKATLKFTWTEAATTVKSLKVYIPLKKGATMNLSAVVDNADAKITYNSSDKSIATVSSKGTVTAKKAGKVAITVKAGTKTVKLYFKVS